MDTWSRSRAFSCTSRWLAPSALGGRVLSAPGARTPAFGRRTCVLTATRPIGVRSIWRRYERDRVVVAASAGAGHGDPQEAQRLELAGLLDGADVQCVPAEAVEDLRHGRLGVGVVAGDEHGEAA